MISGVEAEEIGLADYAVKQNENVDAAYQEPLYWLKRFYLGDLWQFEWQNCQSIEAYWWVHCDLLGMY